MDNLKQTFLVLLLVLLAGCDWFDKDKKSPKVTAPTESIVTPPDANEAPEPSNLAIPEDGYVVSYEYDDSGRVVKASYSDRGEVSYEYDNAGNILNVEMNAQ